MATAKKVTKSSKVSKGRKICKDGRIWGQNNSYDLLEYRHKMHQRKITNYERVSKDGYVLVLVVNRSFTTKAHYELKHRIIMENHIGRPLSDNEVVHHLNCIKDDNRIENLALYADNGIHMRLHALIENNKKLLKKLGKVKVD